MSQVESGHQVHLPAPHSTNTLCSQNFFNIQHYQVKLLPAKCYLVCIINIYRWIATFCAKKFLKWKNEFIVALNERPSCSLLSFSTFCSYCWLNNSRKCHWIQLASWNNAICLLQLFLILISLSLKLNTCSFMFTSSLTYSMDIRNILLCQNTKLSSKYGLYSY